MGALTTVAKFLLCFAFFLSGICKLTPKWGEEVYNSMDVAFRDRFTPFWQDMFFLSHIGVKLDATVVKHIYGSTEVLCAFLLFTSYKMFSSIILFGLMSGVVLTHIFLGEWSHIPMPFVLCIFSLGVCYVGGTPPALSAGGGKKAKRS